MIQAVVHYSGGLMSFGAAKIACEKYGPENTVLLFADTGSESDDTYKFILQTSSYLGARLVTVRCMFGNSRAYVRAWDVHRKAKLISTWKYGLCTSELKKKPLNRWTKCNAPEAANVIGFSIEEIERIDRLRKARPDIRWEFPLAERPYTDICTIAEWLRDANIAPPNAYAEGHAHNNCGGACFKMGAKSWARLYKTNCDLFLFHENQERQFNETFGKQYSIIRKTDKTAEKGWRNYTLEELRHDIDAGRLIPADGIRQPCACGILWEEQDDMLPGWNADEEGGEA